MKPIYEFPAYKNDPAERVIVSIFTLGLCVVVVCLLFAIGAMLT